MINEHTLAKITKAYPVPSAKEIGLEKWPKTYKYLIPFLQGAQEVSIPTPIWNTFTILSVLCWDSSIIKQVLANVIDLEGEKVPVSVLSSAVRKYVKYINARPNGEMILNDTFPSTECHATT